MCNSNLATSRRFSRQAALALCAGLVIATLAATITAAERGIGQPWPDSLPQSSTERILGAGHASWSVFPALSGTAHLRRPAPLSQVGRQGISSCDPPPAARGATRDVSFPVAPDLERNFTGDWSGTYRSGPLDIGCGLAWAGGLYNCGWPGYSPTGYHALGYRPWWNYPYVQRPWFAGYAPYYGAGYQSFYRPGYLYAPGYSGWSAPGFAFGGGAPACLRPGFSSTGTYVGPWYGNWWNSPDTRSLSQGGWGGCYYW